MSNNKAPSYVPKFVPDSCVHLKMDEFRHSVIELVKNQPLLWDPSHEDYRYKKKRNLVWNEIETAVHPPEGVATTARSTWEGLKRGFCNALRRVEKKYTNNPNIEQTSIKEWKFTKDLMFLIPIKQSRSSTGNLMLFEQSDEESDNDENAHYNVKTEVPQEDFDPISACNGDSEKTNQAMTDESQTHFIHKTSKKRKKEDDEDEQIDQCRKHSITTREDQVRVDEFRQSVIELVKNRPILWDPSHDDYRNKAKRQQTWDEIEMVAQRPEGVALTAKYTWDSLQRGFNNALKRMEKNVALNGHNSLKEWKFTKDLMFLIPIKQSRGSTGNLKLVQQSGDEESDNDENIHCDYKTEAPEENSDDVSLYSDDIEAANQVMTAQSQAPFIHEISKKIKKADDEDERMDQSCIPAREQQVCVESPRLNFFRSIMPNVDSLSNDDFLDFQMDVLQLLRRHREKSS